MVRALAGCRKPSSSVTIAEGFAFIEETPAPRMRNVAAAPRWRSPGGHHGSTILADVLFPVVSWYHLNKSGEE